jgi:hypothetical protein
MVTALVSVVASAFQAKIPASSSASAPEIPMANLRISTPFLKSYEKAPPISAEGANFTALASADAAYNVAASI